MFKKAFITILSLSIFVTALSGCNTDNGKEKNSVNLAFVDWSDSVAITNLAAAVLEEKMGYDVNIKMADIAPIFTSIASGNTDAYLDAWLPITHKSYIEKYGDDMVDLGPIYEDASLGLIVPSYVNINSIDELNNNKELFDGKIIGIDAGAGIMLAAEKALKEYDLDYKLVNGSAATMTAALGKAVDAKEPIIVTGWRPHWMFARWDLKVLKDPKGVFGEKEIAHKYVRKGLEDMPEVGAFFRKIQLNETELDDLMKKIENSEEDPLDVAKSWVNQHEDLVNSWIEP